jgi:hypothetical protein
MNRELFLESTLNQISQVYLGKNHYCRCGCGGSYTATSFMDEPRSDINDKLVEKRLKKAKALILKGVDVEYGKEYVNIETRNNRALTFYFDEVRN